MRSRNNNNKKELDLVEIHNAITEVIDNAPQILYDNEAKSNLNFEDCLHAIETLARPTCPTSIKEDLGKKLLLCIAAASQNAQSWKLLVLTIIRKRYHHKSPKAKDIKQQQKQDNNNEICTGSGHGERLTFYVIFVILYCLSRTTDNHTDNDVDVVTDFSRKACECLAMVALPAGGCRDLCALMEHLVHRTLLEAGVFTIQKDEGNKRALCCSAITLLFNQRPQETDLSNSHLNISKVLNDLLHVSVDLLDNDCALVANNNEQEPSPIHMKQKTEKETNKDRILQSTMNTFIPHNGRGVKERKLVQTISELLIWSRTKHSTTDMKCKKALEELYEVCSSTLKDQADDSSSDDIIIPLIHTIQTSIRRERKKLNSSSRNQGFALMSSFQIDPSSINLSMIRAGKEGDVSVLKKLAMKKADRRVLNLVSMRYQDPSKAVPFSSVCAMRREWIPLLSTDVSDEGTDEFHQLNLKMQEASVRATIELLRKKISTSEKKEIVLASLDGTVDNSCAAVLIAAALNSHCVWDTKKEEVQDEENMKVTLFIGENTTSCCDVSSPSNVMSLLNTIITSNEKNTGNEREGEENYTPTTTKDLQNLIERHLEPNSNLIIFASTDVKLEQRVLQDLQSNNNNIHCHIIDEWSHRMEREKAKVGDVTITLLWDNECDLDLHCYCPNGDHISYINKEGGGGYLDVDMNAGGGGSKEPVENIFFGDAEKSIQAAKGKYKVVVQNYTYHGSEVKEGDPVKWRVRVSMNNEISTYEGECVGTGSSSDVTVVEFVYKGRTVAEPEKVGTAMTSSNLVSVTSSHGETIDSLSQLVMLHTQYEELNNVRDLISTTEETDVVEQENSHTLMAARTTFELTNRERHFLNLSKLPMSFQSLVDVTFGDTNLADAAASSLAKRLIEDGIHIEEMKKAGYPKELVELVCMKMKTLGL